MSARQRHADRRSYGRDLNTPFGEIRESRKLRGGPGGPAVVSVDRGWSTGAPYKAKRRSPGQRSLDIQAEAINSGRIPLQNYTLPTGPPSFVLALWVHPPPRCCACSTPPPAPFSMPKAPSSSENSSSKANAPSLKRYQVGALLVLHSSHSSFSPAK